MGFLERLSSTIATKANAVLSMLEDPNQSLDYVIDQQRSSLHEMGQGIVDVVTARKRLEIQCVNVRDQIAELETAARLATDDVIARPVIARKLAMQKNLQYMEVVIEDIKVRETDLKQSRNLLQIELDQLDAKRGSLRAIYSASEAKIKMGEASEDFGKGIGTLGLILARAEDRVEEIQARASAVEELAGREDLVTDAEIEAELVKLRK
jgi:phage shock protein A